VDAFSSGSAILRTKTDGHVAGGYAGGGVGNKSILGHFLAAPLPLASLVSIEFTVLRITPEATFIPPLTNGYAVNVLPYANLVVELVPGSGVYSIFVFGDVNNTLLPGAIGLFADHAVALLAREGGQFGRDRRRLEIGGQQLEVALQRTEAGHQPRTCMTCSAAASPM
jgi:hypothetical protein